MSDDGKILLIGSVVWGVVCVTTAATSHIGWLRGMAGVGMLYAMGAVLIAVTRFRESGR